MQHISLSPDSIQNDEVRAWPAEGSAWWGGCACGVGAQAQSGPEDPVHRPWPHS